jgi:hypothetical protein
MYFYQSGSDCLPCPDSTFSIILLTLLAVAAVGIALLVTSIQTPQLQACMKGMVVMVSFFQGFVSLKFLKIEWPALTLQLFQLMSFFSFSMDGINPECTLRFDFALKTILTLSLPFGLAFIVLVIAFGYGLLGCLRLTQMLKNSVRQLPIEHRQNVAHTLLKNYILRRRSSKQLQNFAINKAAGIVSEDENHIRFDTATFFESMKRKQMDEELAMSKLLLQEATFSSCIKAWLSVVFFRKVEYNHAENVFWFALCPVLLTRLKTRMERSARENWMLAKSKLKMKRIVTGMRLRMAVNQKPDPLHDEKYKVYMKLMSKFGLDTWFQIQCDRGRKFTSGVASIFILTYAGSVQSVLSSWNCQERGGKRFVVLDPETECSADDPKYLSLLIISIFGIFIYCGVLPLCIWIVLTSKWCRRFYVSERAAYEGMLGFLTQRYNQRAYLWELVVFMKKFAAASIPIYFASSKITQSILSLFAYFLYLLAIFKQYPLATLRLNQVNTLRKRTTNTKITRPFQIEILNNLSLFLMYDTRNCLEMKQSTADPVD